MINLCATKFWASDDDLTSVEMSCSETESCDGLPDFPAFSPEAFDFMDV